MKRLFLLFSILSLTSLFSACDFDESCPIEADMVKITGSDASFYIDAYEASRTNATNATMGTGITMACNTQNVIPWSNVTYEDARNACLDAGKRLCSKSEWLAACEMAYPYGANYQADTCNDSTGFEQLATGSKPNCKTNSGIYDMSGNVREWVEGGILMGGAYDSAANDASCSAALSHEADYYNYTPSAGDGFRCCSDEKLIKSDISLF